MTQGATSDDLAELYRVHGPALLAYLVRFTRGDRQRAEDLLQETVLRAWRRPESRRADGTWHLPWLFTVARNVAIDQFRAVAARPTEVADEHLDEWAHSDSNVMTVLDGSAVRAAVAALPDRLRDVLVELYLRDRSVADTAVALGVPPGTVKSRAHYALRALHRLLYKRQFFAS